MHFNITKTSEPKSFSGFGLNICPTRYWFFPSQRVTGHVFQRNLNFSPPQIIHGCSWNCRSCFSLGRGFYLLGSKWSGSATTDATQSSTDFNSASKYKLHYPICFHVLHLNHLKPNKTMWNYFPTLCSPISARKLLISSYTFSAACPSDKSGIKMKVNMEHWRNDTNGTTEILSQCSLSRWPGI
jgi:hypothetical protein